MEKQIPTLEELLPGAERAAKRENSVEIAEKARSPNAANEKAQKRRFNEDNRLDCWNLARMKKYYPDKYQELIAKYAELRAERAARRQKKVEEIVEEVVSEPAAAVTPPPRKKGLPKWVYIGATAVLCLVLVLVGVLVRGSDEQELLDQSITLSNLQNDGRVHSIYVGEQLDCGFPNFVKGQKIQVEIWTYGIVKNGVTISLRGQISGIEKKLISGLIINEKGDNERYFEKTISLEIPSDLPITSIEYGREVRERYYLYVYNSLFSSLGEALTFCKENELRFSYYFYKDRSRYEDSQYMRKKKGVFRNDLYRVVSNYSPYQGHYLLEREEDKPEIQILFPKGYRHYYGKPIPVELKCSNIAGKRIEIEILRYEYVCSGSLPVPILLAFKELMLGDDGMIKIEIKDYTSYLMVDKEYRMSFSGVDQYGLKIERLVFFRLFYELDP